MLQGDVARDDDDDRTLEMQLNVTLGSLVFQTEGPVAQAGAYFQRALEISQGTGRT